ncbi:MAG: hypothetical protein RLZZ164_1133 [Actinomycetota bacterium]
MTHILDIRTPEEVADGHIAGAIIVDFKNENFSTEIAKLDMAADYIIHCRSGQRVSNAIPMMRDLGFTGELTNAGGIEDAAAMTGQPIVID